MEDYIEWMVLSQLPGIGPIGFRQLLKHFGDPAIVLRSSKKELRQVPGIRNAFIQGFDGRDQLRDKCLHQLQRLKKMGGHCLSCRDDDYPQLLKELKDPPPLLYLLGDKKILNSCCVGVVGSRAATSYGRRTAFSLAKRLAEKGVTIISGLALGIDTESHKGALAATGKTVAVLGCGIDVVYPRQNIKLFEQIGSEGVIVSEYPLATAPEGFRFPARNRIIAGMSLGVLVVEAAKKSGSLITAQIALDEGREVYAVPGQVDSYKSEGTHWLLQQGAKLVQSEMDILEELRIDVDCKFEPQEMRPQVADSFLEPGAAQLLEYIEPYPCSRDILIEKSGLEVPVFSELLLVLELEGYIEILPGDEIRRLAPS